MKATCLLLFFTVLNAGLLFAQSDVLNIPFLNPSTNSISVAGKERSMVSENNGAETQQVKCAPKSFWSVDANGLILQWELINGSSIQFIDTVFLTSPVNSLAICDALNGSGSSPAFYGDAGSNAVGYFDGTAWQTAGITPTLTFFNSGGYGSHLYFQGGGFNQFYQYDGVNMTLVAQFAGREGSCADMAVDELANIWIPTQQPGGLADSITVISPSTGIIYSFAISQPYDRNHSYGCFMLDGILYVGFGSSSTIYPNMLVPFTFSGSTATIGNPIPFPNSDFYDLASCHPGDPIAMGMENPKNADEPGIYPNPSDKIFTIEFLDGMEVKSVKIYNHAGEVIFVRANSDFEKSISVECDHLADGIYHIVVEGIGFRLNRKLHILH